ncbi:MAG: hypothetical protein ABSE53_04990 [Terracidiphilus sp.]
MRSQRSPQAESPRPLCSLLRSKHLALRQTPRFTASFTAWAALCAASFLSSGELLRAQTNSSPAPAAPAHKSVHPHKKPVAAVPAPQPAPPPAPVVPPPPNWPANDLPGAASVVFDSRGLLIVASNSSLAQILKDVSTDTGAKVEGMGADQRIFGTYGPGPARDVLSQLLDGSGYNVLMVGDRGAGTPRRIVLTIPPGSTIQSKATNTPAPPRNDDTDSDQSASESDAEQEPPQPAPNSVAPPVPIRTPQQMIQERDRQMQQTQNGQQNPQN